jgi:hypothetical protein
VSYTLFVDDERFPVNSESIIVRNFEEFKAIIEGLGMPKEISFDHDLGESEPTGYDIVKWLIEQDMDHDFLNEDFTFSVHSQNPVGAENIRNLLNNYLAFKFLT